LAPFKNHGFTASGNCKIEVFKASHEFPKKTARARFTYWLADASFFIHDIKNKFDLPETDAYKEFMRLQFERMVDVLLSFFQTRLFTSQAWKGRKQKNRHLFTRYAVHGFHHLICNNKECHERATEE
jgi:hypothetical protein